MPGFREEGGIAVARVMAWEASDIDNRLTSWLTCTAFPSSWPPGPLRVQRVTVTPARDPE